MQAKTAISYVSRFVFISALPWVYTFLTLQLLVLNRSNAWLGEKSGWVAWADAGSASSAVEGDRSVWSKSYKMNTQYKTDRATEGP